MSTIPNGMGTSGDTNAPVEQTAFREAAAISAGVPYDVAREFGRVGQMQVAELRIAAEPLDGGRGVWVVTATMSRPPKVTEPTWHAVLGNATLQLMVTCPMAAAMALDDEGSTVLVLHPGRSLGTPAELADAIEAAVSLSLCVLAPPPVGIEDAVIAAVRKGGHPFSERGLQ